ncbi:putative transcriptional regulator [Desulfosporosinus orientis DSM 765]|uniref:Putative transcriptional regulator n=1 Tax=Desulfosporosinus orientis (strain ATCC 19365 / DSM 765 / NCIMB 8382 / VKM B-1628 / Singapore I) TaxID=768706 RepID=G7W6E1_DESOD|nr:helix-turn-helix domain-containing protein [Desulfosporosinus orientis]AET68148.1 putative transcriptional regulator [Desulfosporosinus orientis DSM 765]
MLGKEDKHAACHMRDKCTKYDICPMVLVQNILSGKRKIIILWYLSYTTLRFNEIKKKLPDVTQKMLTQQLRSLEEDGLIYRNVYPVVPPRVEYGLTELGKKIIPLLEMMHSFGADYLELKEAAGDCAFLPRN